jgi:hypothetical protein
MSHDFSAGDDHSIVTCSKWNLSIFFSQPETVKKDDFPTPFGRLNINQWAPGNRYIETAWVTIAGS